MSFIVVVLFLISSESFVREITFVTFVILRYMATRNNIPLSSNQTFVHIDCEQGVTFLPRLIGIYHTSLFISYMKIKLHKRNLSCFQYNT